jgi:tRNA(Ile)-lysidine synthase
LNPAFLALQGFEGAGGLTPPIAVAYSGGADSTALLLAAAKRWPGEVMAIHVHHGLQAAADDFERSCAELCQAHQIPLHVIRVDARNVPGDSPEDTARRARYAALANAATSSGVKCVLLGQHADDQVETLLLALSRGAGLPGLAAMPASFERNGIVFFRPLLEVPGPHLREWLQAHGHAFIEDPSNADEQFTRNRIRARLLPALAQSFPQFRQTFARSARHAAQAQALLDEVAVEDLVRVGSPPVIMTLQTLSRARQANVLRHWLVSMHDARPSAAQLGELLHQVAACRTLGHRIHLKVASGHVTLEAGTLVYANAQGL